MFHLPPEKLSSYVLPPVDPPPEFQRRIPSRQEGFNISVQPKLHVSREETAAALISLMTSTQAAHIFQKSHPAGSTCPWDLILLYTPSQDNTEGVWRRPDKVTLRCLWILKEMYRKLSFLFLTVSNHWVKVNTLNFISVIRFFQMNLLFKFLKIN